MPALDQTRTVGLVTLPGAFIGALLGGASAVGAARFQIVVLVGLLCARGDHGGAADLPARRAAHAARAVSRLRRPVEPNARSAGQVLRGGSRLPEPARCPGRTPRPPAGAAAGPSTGPVRARWSPAGCARRSSARCRRGSERSVVLLGDQVVDLVAGSVARCRATSRHPPRARDRPLRRPATGAFTLRRAAPDRALERTAVRCRVRRCPATERLPIRRDRPDAVRQESTA